MEKKIKIVVHTKDNITNESALRNSDWKMTMPNTELGDRWEKDAMLDPNDQAKAEKLFGAAVWDFYNAAGRNKPNIHMAITDLIN
ncbi:MAG TPA: hypothetical protein PLY93_13555 [Turneriella sp.]|nr:hypothetical protein [Turneriella sp.]